MFLLKIRLSDFSQGESIVDRFLFLSIPFLLEAESYERQVPKREKVPPLPHSLISFDKNFQFFNEKTKFGVLVKQFFFVLKMVFEKHSNIFVCFVYEKNYNFFGWEVSTKSKPQHVLKFSADKYLAFPTSSGVQPMAAWLSGMPHCQAGGGLESILEEVGMRCGCLPSTCGAGTSFPADRRVLCPIHMVANLSSMRRE